MSYCQKKKPIAIKRLPLVKERKRLQNAASSGPIKCPTSHYNNSSESST